MIEFFNHLPRWATIALFPPDILILFFVLMLENLKLGPRYDGFLFLARSKLNPPRLKPHHHIELELNLVVRGSITYVVGGERYRFDHRSLLWMFPAQEHQLVDRTSDAEYFVAVFKPGLIEQTCRSPEYAGLRRKRFQGVLHTELTPPSFDLVKKTMESLVEDGLDPAVLNREAGFGLSPDFHFSHGDPDWLNAGLRHLLLLCWRLQSRCSDRAKRSVTLHPAVNRALQELDHQDEELNLASLARTCGVSPAYLSRVFARQVGVPLSRYRNSVRLSRYWEARRQTDNLTEAAFAAGFGSYAQFFKVYRQAYGSDPRSNSAKSARQR